jgi:hypothetical protein
MVAPVEERAGVVHPPSLKAERDWPPRMDPPNVLWFFGAITTAVAVNLLISDIPDSHNGIWTFLVGLGFVLGFALASWYLLQLSWWTPGGLAAALAVASFPGVAIGFLRLIDVWPDDGLSQPSNDFSAYPFVVALATAAVGLLAFMVTRFAFIFAVVVTAILTAAQLLVPAFESSPNGDDRATMAIIVGAALVVLGVFLDAFGRRRDAFWFHALGFFAIAAAIVYWASLSSGDHERGWIPMLIAGVIVTLVAGPTRRATWAVYGVLGYYAAIVRYMVNGLNQNRWPFAFFLLILALSIFLMGILLRRYGRMWADRFVHRPPPGLEPPT